MIWLLRHVIGGYARAHPLRAIVQVVAIAVGVALGYAVHLINASALAEFASAVRQVSGAADASIVGAPGALGGFDERIYADALRDTAVELANPVLEIEAVLVEPAHARGRPLAILGVDALRAALLAPHTVGEPDAAAGADPRFALLDDGVFLSPAALESLRVAPGDSLAVQVGGRIERLRVVGRVPGARAGQIVGTMDIGFAQWRFDRLGRLTRIDLRLAPGAELAALARRLDLPAGVAIVGAEAAAARVSNLSRAYRINLNVLALVALFTGAFLVYSLQSQAVAARRAQLAFLRVIGAVRGEVERLLVLESIAFGAMGAALGVLAGLAVAAAALRVLGGDLGGGFFTGVQPALAFDAFNAAGFFALGVAAAVAGGWLPARDAARAAPAPALKAGSGLDADATPQRAWPSLALLAAAAALLAAPPLAGVPIAAYLAIALLLVAAILLKPTLAPLVFGPLARRLQQRRLPPAAAPAWLAATRLAATPRFAAIGASGIVASFALMVAMATMVASFRHSVDAWLQRVLPADIYVRAAPLANAGVSSAAFSARDLQTLASHPAVARAEFARNLKISLDAARAPVTLIARPVDRADPGRTIPLTGASAAWRPGLAPPAWVSEAIVDLYGARVGGEIELPIAQRAQRFFVAGVWRDYARQFGAIIVDVEDYVRASGDTSRTEAALWLKPGHGAAQVIRELQGKLDAAAADFHEPGEIRAISLRIFDRSFAVTYVLEIAAICIGLTGVAATFSAQAIARTREFGMLRHVGVTRTQILALLALEGLLVTLLAVALGLAAGLAVAWVLIDIVNPQSFHWTMDFRLPAALIGALIAALLAAAAATAVVAGRRAVSGEAVLAIREDW
jgi:putative ABC transport system permease protein